METKINSQATTDVIKNSGCDDFVAGVFGFYSYSEISDLYHIALIVVAGIALLLYRLDCRRAKYTGVLESAQSEIRKVVWPTRQETSQTTLVVLVVVVFLR